MNTWRDLMDSYFPGAAWIRLRHETLDALQRFKARRALFTWDETIDALMEARGSPWHEQTSNRPARIADAVLYEGYILYPYRPSSVKNQFRWQFGIVAPRVWSEGGGEPWEMQTECLVESRGAPAISGTIRFLQVEEDKREFDAAWETGSGADHRNRPATRSIP